MGALLGGGGACVLPPPSPGPRQAVLRNPIGLGCLWARAEWRGPRPMGARGRRPASRSRPSPWRRGAEGGGGGMEPAGLEEEEEEVPAPPPMALPAAPAPAPARGSCLLGNWQEERATHEADRVPSPWDGSEGFCFRHGHRGLIAGPWPAGFAKSTTMKDAYRRPHRSGLPTRGQREAMMEWLLYQKYSKEVLEEDVAPLPDPVESLSTMHRDYRREGFISVPPAPTKPHNYRTEQPETYWLEHAQQVPGVSSIQTDDTPFKKNASFSTPVTDKLDQPLLYGSENDPKL